MKIAVLGTGNVGGVLGGRWAEKGHEIVFGSRDPEHERVQQLVEEAGEAVRVVPVAEATADAEVVVLATPWPSAEETLRAAGPLEGRIVVDCINPINAEFSGLDVGAGASAAEEVAAWAPKARVVKAFNTVSAGVMANPVFGDQRAVLFYCGDDDQAKQIVRRLIDDLEFDPIDVGPLSMARYLEPLTMLYIHMAGHQGWKSDFAFAVLRR